MRVAWHLLGFLPLLGPNGVHADILLPECSLQGWVRAPDLSPDTIIQGDARLKLTARCTAVESASLGLRFKERSFVKASRSIEATKRPTREQTVIDIFDPEHNSPSSPWVPPVHDSFNCSADIAFELIVKNKDLWLVKEEERIVFESTQGIDMGEAQPGSVRDVVRDFAILVPSTNFPPALHYPRAQVGWREGEFVNVEAMYEYFVRVAFANGTRVEIPVGFTAFHPLYDPPSNNVVRSKTVQLQTKESLDGSPVDNDPVANYTAEISSKRDGFAFSQGQSSPNSVAITRTGRARTFVEPLNLHLCIDSTLSPKWAPEHNPTLQSLHKPNQILRATSADFKMLTSPSTSRCIRNQGHTREPKPVPMPNATADQIAAAAIVTMTSKPVHFLIGADPRHATDFETYYHTLSSALFLSLDVPRTQDEPPNPEDMFELRAMRKKMPEVGVDEEAWVPWTNVPEVAHWRAHRTYTGNVSVSVVVGDSADCALRSPVHYLAKGARAPTFVDGGAAQVQALLSKTAAERDALAPLLEPVVSSPPEGEERVHRYYRVPEGHRPLIYVGETWVKKVAHSDDHKVTAPRPDTIPTALAQMAAAMRHMFDEL
ncbi:hypothetical protein OG21DRAFT_1410837 [Imleria badia]|nr:hypothetical protein OG21DRAFT_1410837 [Imleria badia]